ncbi:MAG: CDP-alcohol phosphatidyltransferase family protein [Phycisphaerales bacterium JB059]
MSPPVGHAPARPPATGIRARIPNALTIARLLLAAAFFALIEVGLRLPTDPWTEPDDGRTGVLHAAMALCVVAAATDALDGYLARKWNAISKFGRIMDPFADKILVLGAFVTLAGPLFHQPPPLGEAGAGWQASGVAPWMAVLILARELLVTSVRGFFEAQGVDFSADLAGKLKMALQSAVVPLVLLLLALTDVSPGTVGRWMIDLSVWMTVLVTLASCLPYVVKGVRAGRGLIHAP